MPTAGKTLPSATAQRSSELCDGVELEYCRRTPKSAELHLAAKRHLPGGDTRSVTYFPPHPLFIRRGIGCRITDEDGNEYLDFLNNYTSQIHGHAHPAISETVVRQLAFGTAFGSPLSLQSQLAEVLCQRAPSLEMVRFCNSGTEATMSAVRAAKAFTGRNKVLKIEGGYHGSHDMAAISVAPPIAEAGPSEEPRSIPGTPGLFAGVVADVVIAPFNHNQAAARIIERHGSDLAAVIVEPVMGSAGMIPAQVEYLQLLRSATESCGALLIFDEVITFRLAYGGAQEHYRIKPDLTTLGKIIGGGFPVGAFGGRADIMSQFDPQNGRMRQSGTFNGNAITMAAGLAALEVLTRDEIARINQLGDRLRRGLRSAIAAAGVAGQITGIGSLTGVHFTANEVRDYRSAARGAKDVLHFLHLFLLNHGIYAAPRGDFYVSTPMEERHIDTVIREFSSAVASLPR
jgi:glutamate-1-semialdehyde 2,1-aminomutase